MGQKVLADGVEIIEFPDMKHGWTVKGDLSVPEVERDVKKTFNLVLTFFGKYLHWYVRPVPHDKEINCAHDKKWLMWTSDGLIWVE